MDEKFANRHSSITKSDQHDSSRRNHQYGLHTVSVAILLGIGYLLCSFAPEPYNRARAEHALKKLQRLQDLQSATGPDSVWGRITSSEKLHWTTCYEDKECAKLSVPLDYHNPGFQASIALLRVPAKIPPGQDGYKGPVLVNPGGPGGSGTYFVRDRGKQLQTILGDGYDIVGFDPRGIGFTHPSLLLFKTEAEEAAWELRHEANPPLNATPDALARDVARWKVFGDLAQKRFQSDAEYVSTAMVSRDMLRITEAHGYEKVKYWGFSYGSVLGITFAAMFPDKVERLIVDGVCDTYDYYEAQWSNNLRDTDAGLDMFYQACVDAGPDECALHASDAAGVKERVDSIFAALKSRPIPIHARKNSTVTSDMADYGLVDYRMARSLTFRFLYAPYGSKGLDAAALSRALAATETGDGRSLWDLAARVRQKEFRCNCDQDEDKEETRQAQMDREGTLAIACSDGDVVNDSLEELQNHYEGMAKMSSFAELWNIRITCAGWKIRAKERFRGPFVGNTSYPILLIGNTADPVTPLWNARKMAIGFKDAAVLHQKSAGHCSLAAASLCTAKVVRNYFQHGQLPAVNAECEVESQFFGETSKADVAGINADDAELLQALHELSHEFRAPMFHM